LTGKCANTKIEHHLGACEYLKEGPALTLTATACSMDKVRIGGLEAFNRMTGKSVAINKNYVKFFKVSSKGAVTGGMEVKPGTEQSGNFYVKLTVDGQTARYAFSVSAKGKKGQKSKEEAARLKAQKNAQAAMNKGVRVKRKGKKLQINWTKAKLADGYMVYVGCGKEKPRKIKTIARNSTTKLVIKKIKGKKINKKKNYRAYVVAYKKINGKKVQLARSQEAYCGNRK
jgi:hypothetical protein